MGYRVPDTMPDMRLHLHDAATQSLVTIDNGTISRIVIPCHYAHEEFHDVMEHDHVGWPSPDSPDASCQIQPRRDRVLVLEAIDLPGEGYTAVEVAFVDPPSGLHGEGMVGDGYVAVLFEAMCEDLMTEDADVQFSVFALGSYEYLDEETVSMRDVVIKGTLHIVGGPFVVQGD